MSIKGKAFKFGDDVNTDEIIPARRLNSSDSLELAKYCMEDADPEFVNKMQKGDIIVAGKNFGCGSSREHAPIAIKYAGISCVIAPTFARIFYRNAINTGLPILESDEASKGISDGYVVSVDLENGKIINETTGKSYNSEPFPEFMRDIVESGGLIEWTRKKVGTA